MIRNLLYSFFCHLFLAIFIYFASSTFIHYTDLDLHNNKKAEEITLNNHTAKPKPQPTVAPKPSPVTAISSQELEKLYAATSTDEQPLMNKFVSMEDRKVITAATGRRKIFQQLAAIEVSDAVNSLKQKHAVLQQVETELEILASARIQAEKTAKRQAIAEAKRTEALLKAQLAKERAAAAQAAAKAKDDLEAELVQKQLDTNNLLGSGNLGAEEGFRRDLSARDKIQIQTQLVSCYKRAIQYNNHNSKITINVQVDLQRNGTMLINKAKMQPEDSTIPHSGELYEQAIQNAKLALTYCNPLRNLPKDKYFLWKHLSFSFDTENLETQLH